MCMSYQVRIECGNCNSRNNYNVDRGVPCNGANLVCPNCDCCPTDQNYIVYKDNGVGRHTTKSENEK